ncbi:MAG: hypothetical protein JRG79_06680 [Deltaproteobacteria bacterium]|nr:hypothetical protein [Deltaproteobacteria bacterium]
MERKDAGDFHGTALRIGEKIRLFNSCASISAGTGPSAISLVKTTAKRPRMTNPDICERFRSGLLV